MYRYLGILYNIRAQLLLIEKLRCQSGQFEYIKYLNIFQ